MAQYLPLPDGSYLKLQEGESPAAGLQRAQQKYPEAFASQAPAPKPEGGFIAAAKAGATELGGGLSALAGKLGLKDESKAEAEYQAAKKRAAEIFKPTEEGWTEAPFTKFKELLGGSVPYMAAPLAAGAAAAALPVTGTAAALTTLGAAGLTSAGQFTATNLSRQLEEGKKLAETDLGAAALAAVPQAALDTLSMRMIPGIGRIFGQAGVKITAENAKEIAEQGLKKTLIDYTAKTGKTAGIEGVTEATQQVFERLQAGLSITDPQARQEYFDSFIGGAVLGGTLAPVGRAVERGGEKREARGLLETQAQEERAATAKAEAEKKKDPGYVLGIADEYDALSQQKEALKSQIVKGTKEAPLTREAADRNAIIQKQISELDPQIKEKRNAYLAAGGPDAAKKAREQVLQLAPPPGQVTAPPPEEVAPESPEVAGPRAQKEVDTLTALLEQQRTQLQGAQSPEEALELAQRTQRTKDALDKSQEMLSKMPVAPVAPDLEALQAKLTAAQQAGEQGDVIKYATQLIEARKQAPAQDMGLFDPAQMVAEDERRRQLAEEMATGREAAAQAPKVPELLARAPEEAQRAQVAEQMQAEGRAEREALTETAQDLASSMRARELGALQTAPQLTLFPRARETVTRTTTEENRVAGLRNELAQQTNLLDRLMARPAAPEGLPTQATEGPYSVLEMPKAKQAQIAAVERRIEDLKGQIAKAPTTRPGRTERVEGTPELAAPEAEVRRPLLIQRINTMAEQALASPRVDEQTKALVAQVQDRLPQLRALVSERPQAARAEKATSPLVSENMRLRLGRKERQAAAGLRTAPQEIAAWLYRTNQGQAAPEATARVQELLRMVETPSAGRVSEAPLIGSTVRRAPPPKPAAPAAETRADREARDAQARVAEQELLERRETEPATRIEFERAVTTDENLRKLMEKMQAAPSAEERVAARKELEEYTLSFIERKNTDLQEMKRKAAKNVQDLNTQRKAVSELTERLKSDLTPKRRATAEKQLAEAQRKLAEHQRRYTLNTREMKITRTDIQAQREERNRLLAESSRMRVAGERLGVAEGTQQRAVGPLTRVEVIPPKALRTESPESRAGITATDTRQKLTEARGEKQRDVPITKAEMAEAEAQAAAMPTRVAREEFSTFTQEAKAIKARATELAASTEAAEVKDVQQVVKSLDKLIKQADKEAAAFGISDESLRRWEKASYDLKTARSKLNVRLGKDVAFRETGPQYETRELTDLTPAALEAVEDGDIRTALADLEKNGSTPFVRELAKHLGDMTMRTKLEVRDKVEHKGEQVEGLYDPAKNLAVLHRGALSEETLTHELTHAATMRALEADLSTLTPTQQAARKEIEGMHAAIEKQPDFTKEYGRKDVKEFVSELMSNQDFRNKLDAQKPNFVMRMYNAFMRVIGFPRATMSEKAVKAAYELFMPAQVLKAAPAPSAKRGAPGLATANRVADSLIAKEKGWVTKLKDNFLGMGFRTQFVDKLAPTEEALKRGGTDPTKALQAMYYLRMYDQRMHFTSQSITEGVPELVEKTRRDGTTERLIETKAGANIQQIVDILKGKDVVKAAGSPDAANKLFTLYLAAIRGERVGYDTLNFGRVWAEAEVKRIESQLKATTISQEQRAVLQKRKKSLEEKLPTMPTAADIKAARAEIEADPTLKKAFDEARDIYNQYNRNLLEFSVQTGALSRAQANEYLRNNDYIPYYRMRDGVAEMVIGNETPIRIGNLKDSPHLKELVGGDEAIFDFLTSSVQNTSMLLDMATKNLATKNLMFELRDVGLATVAKVPKSGKTPEGAVTFKRDGEDHYAVVDTDAIGIDSDLLVKGLAGIPTMFPAFVRVLGVPARLLRRAVVASPVYMARQLFRDSLGATMTSGADIIPLLSALNQIGKPNALRSRGITGGQVFTGMPEDVTRMLKDMQAGKISVTNGLSYLEAKAAQVDALTRKAQYESYLKQGLSEMEATYMALESMNFSKRGLSPGIHMLSTLIPFFNAQIQGLDVLYKSFTGQMPLNERLDVRQKLWERGLMLAGLSIAYAMYMQDDETYKNAKPEEKYGNWFVQVPGFEQMVRLPIPFELGYIFKALPEALVNIAMNENGGEEAMKAFKHIAQQMVPGASSYFIPQAVKPALEALAFEKSLYTGRSIESTQEQMMEPGYRYRDNTTALAREAGELTGFSPIKIEYLIRGYTGGMGMALLAALSAPFGGEGPEAATKRASDMPVMGTLFQPKDASGIIDATYERMKQVNQVKETYEGLLNKGRQADAEKYLKENVDEMALASVAGSFKQYMGQITEYERQIRASSLTPEKKREALDQARQAKIQLATSVRAATERKAPQAAPA